MRLYIAGPMSGLPDYNYPAFYAAADRLRAAGFDPINPARTEGREGCMTWLDYMRAALRDIADADGIALLPSWQSSRGATVENDLGKSLGLPVKRLDCWITETAKESPDA